MGATENLAVHKEWADAENRYDLSRHREFLHHDIEFHLPDDEIIVGVDAYLAMMQENYRGLVGFHTDIEDRFATDDRVVCRWRSSGTHGNDFFGLPTTGKRIEFAGVSVWEFEGGKARRGYTFPDIAAVMAQLMS